ncbi:uncharacterized protein LOC125708130 isoform X2 [Brienomyrus brachyistius]|uniref:uncharacterized protein LOC125708130 isoform X2 n=2 Tax=Brienomyrus brachyistius TaxID=42636 RepID=UPI0020B4027F|nr:uncharacterized protein LOC125708130 isoform X2 [Brienomyrus brachyistius]
MSTRRKKRRQEQTLQGFRDCKDAQRCSSSVDRLAFKYMMCKVESSTDSGSDTSPRWSDTSSKGRVSTRHKSGPPRKMLTCAQKPAGRHHLISLDPYDGSSEDSEMSDDEPRMMRQGVSKLRSRCRRGNTNFASFPKDARKCVARPNVVALPPADVQMKSSSDSEVRMGDPGLLSPRAAMPQIGVETPVDSGVHTESPLCTPAISYVGATPLGLLGSPSRQTGLYRQHGESPSFLEIFPKRKSCLPGAEVGERGLRKRQRVVDMELGPLSL